MAVDMFLDFSKATPKVEGETQDSTFANTFHVKSASFGIIQVGTAATGGGLGAGKAQFQDFSFTIDTQKGSPQLMKHCAAGTHFTGGVKLHVRKAGGKQEVFLTYNFTNVLISSYQTGLSDETMDNVTFSYTSVYAEYKAQKPDGTLESTPTRGGWDLKTNKEATV